VGDELAGDGVVVDDVQGLPVQPPHAAGVVAPGDSAAMDQLFGRVPVCARGADLATDRFPAGFAVAAAGSFRIL
jgi:hypothetical protein